ncbi:MAG TPA: glycosyltransferase family 39 protein [Candidatus Acidoferrales bacterium]|nr:glycosyltransferase family 39 protein [Candidatus Acidoferrales bacterium]
MSETRVAEFEERSFAGVRDREVAVNATAILAGLAVAKLLLQFAGIRHYGFFRDELYYMACGEHLAWGYVDQPPLIAGVAWLVRRVLGSSLVSIRLLPVLVGAAVIFLTGVLARELGGGRFAQFLAAVAILFAPAYLAFDSFFSMNAFEPLFWLFCTWIAIRVVKGASPKLWLAFGAVAGVGLENKHTMAVFGLAIVGGLILSGEWKIFRSPWLWIGGLIALALFLPNLVWEARHGWPQIEVVRNAQLHKNLPISPLQFIADQIAFVDPLSLPVWLAGLAWLLFGRDEKRFRFLGWAYLIVMAIFIFSHGKSYYSLPVYTLLMAAGGVAIERFSEIRARAWLRVAFPIALILGGLAALPFGVPVLPVDVFLRYARALPYSQMAKTERDALQAELPQLYADMFGWDNMASTVAGVYHSLPAAEQPGCAILAGNYGEAGAIDYYGPALGLPKAIGGHNSYYYWGPRNYSGSCVIVFGERSEDFIRLFGDVQLAATVTSPHAMPNEQSVPVYVCRKPRAPLSVLWPNFKMII